ncbi:hypothetical protein [Variovorax sp. dw_308]|uniref:hypothetical protein n=1 Tax=Variovorax sp. dw_308 TaxID=2721546 RepID=UPI001C474085|nr:hypothetical protein [Variovorax sp. dw_308]
MHTEALNTSAGRQPLALLLLTTALMGLAACDRKPSTPPAPSAAMAPSASAPSSGAPAATELRPQSSVAPAAATPTDNAPKDVDKAQEQGTSSSSPRVVGPTDGNGDPPK